jgi:hypothetical protein
MSSVSIHIDYKQKQKHIKSHEMGYWLYNAIDHHIPNIAHYTICLLALPITTLQLDQLLVVNCTGYVNPL